ncbi:MAG: beta-glucosidase [Leptospiraceae bacterium]|nr:beta-glucosidase [Leptospiraceae bacterium]MCP5499097.1 beta-glucosidase [Leptospiraceae bacterium]
MQKLEFPKEFVWGTATAAYQIEGSPKEDGKGESIWDRFSHTRGKIRTKETGDIACDHYKRYKEDIALMAELGYSAYRFSVSWPRIMPNGKGPVQKRGMDFYDRLVDELKQKNIEPFLTLYHWDLPQKLQEEGGWLNRDTASYFADYTEEMVKKLGDRVKFWITLNEPWIFTVLGYFLGVHAPGLRKIFRFYKVAHNVLLAHGLSLAKIRAVNKSVRVGITNALSPVHSHRLDKYSHSVTIANAVMNRLWMDPIFLKKYPTAIERKVLAQNKGDIHPEDMKIISAPIDFLGVNNYSRTIIKPLPIPVYPFVPVTAFYPGVKLTEMGWEVYPDGLYQILKWIKEEYGNPPVYITENGVAYKDKLENTKISDPERIDFLKKYLSSVHRAILEGADVRGYFVWSFMDNFEWAEGNAKTFGLVHIDRTSSDLKRYAKDSAYWYSDVIKQNGFQF